MIDYGTRHTDLALKRLEARLRTVYRQAEKDIAAKTEDFWKRHAARDEKYRQQVADGKLSQEDYEAWQRGQVFQGEQWESKRQSIEDVLYNADSTALQMINDGKMDVFTAGANYMGYELEQHGRIDTGFNLYDGPTVTRLLKDDPQILPKARVKKEKAYVWYNKLVNNCVLQGIIQGESINEIAARIGRTTGERTESAMKRNALTAYTGAQNAGRIEGMKQAQQMGIDVKKRWIATMDSRTRDAHRDLDGQVQDVDKPFKSSLGDIMYPGDPKAKPGNVYNCFVGETNVATDSDIIRSYKHDYSGELITVKTASGVQFTCTPNHPILTPSGWVAAKCLNNGDDLLIASIGEVYALRINPHVDHTPSRIDAIHQFFDITGSKRTVGLGVNFHGDVPTSDVEIITQKRFLRNNGDTGCADGIDKFLLKHTNESLAGKGAFMQHFRGIWLAALRFVGGFCEALSLFGRRVIHAVVHGFRPIARRDATVLQAQADSAAGDVQFLRKCLDGFTGKVFADNIVNIEITTVSHVPVYNLQTGNSRYFVNSIIAQNKGKCNGNFAIAHNCHCAVGSVYPKYPAAMTRRDAETGEVVGDMTYREWEAMKKGNPIPIKSKPPQFKIRHAAFTPAESIKEAEEFALQFMGYNGRVSYRGLSLEAANVCNQTLADMRENIPDFKLSGIEPMNMRSNMWKGKTADAAYRWGGDGKLYINPTYYKNVKAYEGHVAEIDGLMQTVLASGQELIDSGRVTGAKADYIAALLETKRQAVSQSYDFMRGTFVHEFGHALEDKYIRKELTTMYPRFDGVKDFLSQSRSTYAKHISGYAIADNHEYIAESFTAWWYGERDKVDPVISKIFEKVMGG